MVDSTGTTGALQGSEGDDDLDWAVVNSLIQAQDFTSRALQSYLLRTRYREDASPESATRHIEEAIDRHRRIIEDLTLARESIETLTEEAD
ncbi:hypothetical protein [Halorarum salinum]|uniref:DUF8103 domain-containing protein n=1 Tax=Halorarum salinum TaxID=2743089 RepID=A0A7D5QFF2_9EURY|nr:hypothetical protein [Halobaculum salinum]QLG61342.1 hypothetical protein HUG12_06175 [Halobaculum salinum]